MIKKIILFAVMMSVFGCAEIEPQPFEPSTGHINTEESPAVDSTIPELVEQVPLLPEPTAVEPPERYTVVVNEVPVKELLFALARDAKVNVDIHPEIEGVVTINAVEQTLPQILKRISNQVDMRYQQDGNNLIISKDTPFLRTYKVDYVNMSRDTTSSNTVATQISATSGGSTESSGGGNNSTTDVSSESLNHFWETLAANVALIINDGTEGSNSEDSVIASPETGILTVRANSKQHEDVQRFIDLTLVSAKRQVLIRVTIAEVQLNEDYQTGINWSLINEATKAGINIASTALTGVPVGTASTFILNYVDPSTTREQKLTATVSLLDEFGKTTILSSPQLMVLNNQTALLKVVENIVYFELDTELTPSTVAGGQSVVSVDTTAQTVPVGIVMAVTPQISENGEISLNVRPTISRVTEFVNDPNPSLIVESAATGAVITLTNPVPQIQVREMESMLRLTDGEIAVLGGLMLDTSNNSDKGLPWVKDQAGIGAAFKETTITERKTELVIFLQPLVINNPSLDIDLKDYKQYLNHAKYLETSSVDE